MNQGVMASLKISRQQWHREDGVEYCARDYTRVWCRQSCVAHKSRDTPSGSQISRPNLGREGCQRKRQLSSPSTGLRSFTGRLVLFARVLSYQLNADPIDHDEATVRSKYSVATVLTSRASTLHTIESVRSIDVDQNPTEHKRTSSGYIVGSYITRVLVLIVITSMGILSVVAVAWW
jgi:hypothetical protein